MSQVNVNSNQSIFGQSVLSPEVNQEERTINLNFLIRFKMYGETKTHLIGAGKYKKLVGKDLAKKHFERAMNSGLEKVVIKIRQHMTITFVSR
jgi:hypothetical protein